MAAEELKKILASIGIVSLLAGAGLANSGCATKGEGAWTGEKSGAGSTKEHPAKEGGSWNGQKK